ncbi:MAG: InlB B-repeat-containing protein, partial [Christensenellaceae bacterium]|nr:InlB B-repeat-containing protein [Christensenellaceae bacterium]
MKNHKRLFTVLLAFIILIVLSALFFSCKAGDHQFAFGEFDHDQGYAEASIKGNISKGTNVTIEAMSFSGYAFVGWFDGDSLISSDSRYSFKMPASDYTLTPKFERAKQTLYLYIHPGQDDFGSISWDIAGSYYSGTTLTVEASPSEHAGFWGWFDGDTLVSKEREYTFDMPERYLGLEAYFYLIGQESIAVSYNDWGSVEITTNESLEIGELTTILAIPGEYYTFLYWVDTTTSQRFTDPEYSFICGKTTPSQYIAFFDIIVASLTFDVEYVTGFSQSHYIQAFAGDRIDFSIDGVFYGYEFVGWYDDAGNLLSKNYYHYIIMPTHSLTISAKVEPAYLIKFEYDDNACTSPTAQIDNSHTSYIYSSGYIELSTTPMEGYFLTGWYYKGNKILPLIGTESCYDLASISIYGLNEDKVITLTPILERRYRLQINYLPQQCLISLQSINEYVYGASINLIVLPEPGYRFLYLIDEVNRTQITTQADYSFNMPERDYVIGVVLAPLFTLTVNYDANLGEIHGILPNYISDEPVELTAVAASASCQFDGWYNDASYTSLISDEYTCKFKMPNDNLQLWAKFVQLYYLTIDASTGGTYTGSASGYYVENAKISLLATSSSDNYYFKGWADDQGAIKCQTKEYNFDMPRQNITLKPKFELLYNLTVNCDNALGEVAGASTGLYTPDTTISLEATPKDGYIFKMFQITKPLGAETITVYTNHYQFEIQNDTIITVVFAVPKRDLTIIYIDNKESVIDEETTTNEVGSSITLYSSKVSDVSYSFVGWYDVDNAFINSNSQYPFTMPDKNLTIYAKYGILYNFNVLYDTSHGTLTGKLGKYTEYTVLSPSMTAKTGYRFDGWYSDNSYTNLLESDATYSFKMPGVDLVIYALIVKVFNVGVRANNSEAATVTQSGTGLYKLNEQVSVSFTIKDDNYAFIGWSTPGNYNFSTLEVYTFNVTEDIEFTAEFDMLYTLTVIHLKDDEQTLISTNKYLKGAPITLSAPTYTDFEFVGWYNSINVNLSSDNSCTINMLGSDATIYAKYLHIYAFTVNFDRDVCKIYDGNDELVLPGSVINKRVGKDFALKFYLKIEESRCEFVGFFDYFISSSVPIETYTTYRSNMPARDLTITIVTIRRYELSINRPYGASAVTQSGYYQENASIDLNISTYYNYIFDGWYSDSLYTVLVSSLPNYSFKMPSSDVTIYVKLLQTYALDVEVNDSTAGSVSGNNKERYLPGETITLTAIPKSDDYVFDTWSVSDDSMSQAVELLPEYTFEMPTYDVDFTAYFYQVYSLTVVFDNTAGEVSGIASGKYRDGTKLDFTINPFEGYTFDATIIIDGVEYYLFVNSDNTCSYTTTSSAAILTVKFKRLYTLTINYDATKCTIGGTKPGKYPAGTSISLTLTNLFDTGFIGWFENDVTGDPLSTGYGYSGIMPESDLTIYAVFDNKVMFDVDYDPLLGSITGASSAQYSVGETLTVTATANDDYGFYGWYADDTFETLKYAGAQYTFDMPDYNLTLYPKFLREYTLEIKTSDASIATVSTDKNGKYAAGASISIKVTIINSLYGFDGWFNNSNIKVASQNEFTLTMPAANYTLTAQFVRLYVLEITYDSAKGTVNGGSTGLYRPGTTLTLVASPKPGYSFIGWYSASSELLGSSATLNYVMPSSAASVEARFAILYTLTLVYDETQGTITGGEAGKFIYNASITLTASPKSQYAFVGWFATQEATEPLYQASTYQFSMPQQNLTLYARFVRVYILSATSDTVGCSISGTKNGSYQVSTSVSLQANYNESAYVFLGWYDNENQKVYASAAYSFNMPAADVTLVAKFAAVHNLTYSTNQSELSITGPLPGLQTVGTMIKLTAPSNSNYQFNGWFLNDASQAVSTNLAYSFDMPSYNVVLVAKYTRLYTLELTCDTNQGTISGSSAGKYAENTSLTVVAAPKEGYKFAGWYNSANDSLLSASSPYSFKMPGGDLSLVAKFVRVYSFAKYTSTGGTVTGTANGNYEAGTAIIITATPNSNYAFIGWFDAPDATTPLSTDTKYEFNMPTYALELTARFAITYQLTVKNINQDKTELSSSSLRYIAGKAVTLTSVSIENYEFAGWYTTSDTILTNDNSYTFNMPSNDHVIVAKFSIIKINFSVSSNNTAFGTVSGTVSGMYDAGTSITVVAQALTYYKFVGWYTQIDELKSSSSSYTFTAPATNLTLIAKFERIYANLTITNTNSQIATITPLYTSQSVAAGSIITIVCSNLDSNYMPYISQGTTEFQFGDGVCDFVMPTTSVTLTVKYKRLYSLTFEAYKIQYMNVSASGEAGSYLSNTSLSVTANVLESAADYSFDGWYDGDEIVSTKTTYTFKMPEKDLHLVARYYPKGMTFNLVNGLYELYGYSGSLTQLDLPDKYNGVTITSIDDIAFKSKSITNVAIPNSYTLIGTSAFRESKITSITIGESLTSISDHAFRDCTKLTTVTIKRASIGARAFQGCISLVNVVLGDDITSIDTYAFYGCTALETITLPSSLTSISTATFYECTSLTGITIHANIESIGSMAFYNCSNLSGLVIQNGVAEIGTSSFAQCAALVNVTIPSSVGSIGTSAFAKCELIYNLAFEDSPTTGTRTIGTYAFSD